ncbi:tautomerase family protein [Qipengyuania spongiae]|uniref:Tautomerase family protein n=1 Tax=Qipengyuania spongiae TaxID=2909673 RepID=A0ABY5SY59_9SPHN|nr:tautomerase family protein [Qipengyuania spongiae]UVI39482.1 tautomerase family protein [Qipengyuania spongiae]
MPHIAVTMHSADAEKAELADRLSAAVTRTLGYGSEAVSVLVEDVVPSQWMDQIYRPQIDAHPGRLVKRPGYGPLSEQNEGEHS